MNNLIHLVDLGSNAPCAQQQQKTTEALESGLVVYFAEYCPISSQNLSEALFSENLLDGKHKNISYNPLTDKLSNYNAQLKNTPLESNLYRLLHDFAHATRQLICDHFPSYKDALEWGRTSYRPAQVEGRKQSVRKDDTRLHVDSFAASPVHGKRILRVFCNINPNQLPRTWHLGESFPEVVQQFAGQIRPYSKPLAILMRMIKATKQLRSPYDHYQLQLHDAMKLSQYYQETAAKTRVDFPSHSTWIVFTDQTSHAALSGQYLLEQTFYLPVSAQQNPEKSPLKQWEKTLNRKLA